MNQPTSRPGGDFSFDIMEQFRAAYAQQLASPDQDEIANNSGLPTNTVGNTSPWHNHLPLWKYPSGKGPEDDLKAAFNPDEYIDSSDEDDEEYEDEDGYPQMTDEEIESLIQELLNDDDDSDE